MTEELNLPIKLVTAPVIEYSFDTVRNRITDITSLVASAMTEGSLADLKTLRVALNKEFEVFETARKAIEKSYMVPLNEFKDDYKEQVTIEVNAALTKIANKIKEEEAKILNGKIETLKEYAIEYALSSDLPEMNRIRYDQLEIHVTPSAELSPIKKAIREKLDRVASEFLAIRSMAHAELVLEEYLTTLDLPSAIKRVNESIDLARRAIEAENARKAEQAAPVVTPEVTPTPEPTIIAPPKVEKVETYVLTITTTEANMLKVIEFLESEDIVYE